MNAHSVRWPVDYEPHGAAIHVVNTCASDAAPEAVWAWLVRPERWNAYDDNVSRIRHLAGAWPVLDRGSRFSWVTFGVPVITEVTECELSSRLAWTGSGRGSRGHQAWLLTGLIGCGTAIRTEETQRGAASLIARPFLARAMRQRHQRWIDGLARIALESDQP